MVRIYPNIVITGTPGTGKSTHSTLLASQYPSLRQIDIGELVKQKSFHTTYLEEWQSYQVDEDALLDYLEPLTGHHAPEPIDDDDDQEEGKYEWDSSELDKDRKDRGGLILDWHTCDVWPERWIDLVVVLRCDHQVLWNRLEKRNYPLNKIQENNQAEIMSVVLEDARESYPSEAIVQLTSQTVDDVEQNVERILEWIKVWRQQRNLPVE